MNKCLTLSCVPSPWKEAHIEGAFDDAWWPAIKRQLLAKKCPKNLRRLVNHYLEDRVVTVNYAGNTCHKNTNIGCVQGSIAGPTFWNLLLDLLQDELEARRRHLRTTWFWCSPDKQLKKSTKRQITFSHMCMGGVSKINLNSRHTKQTHNTKSLINLNLMPLSCTYVHGRESHPNRRRN